MKINTSRKAGFTLVEIMIVVAIIGLLAAIAIPNFVRARNTSQANACINNMRQVDSAVQQWALETGQGDAADPSGASGDIAEYIKGNAIPECPIGGAIELPAALTDNPTCPNVADAPLHVLP
jgi:prepilin-type N-terminal cleavage/methylation domain-containing protein